MKLLFEESGPDSGAGVDTATCDICGIHAVVLTDDAETSRSQFLVCDACGGDLDAARENAYDARGVGDDYAIDQARDDRDERRYA